MPGAVCLVSSRGAEEGQRGAGGREGQREAQGEAEWGGGRGRATGGSRELKKLKQLK